MTEQSNKRLEDLLEGVEGWLPLEDARYLCELAREAPADIVEIGCYRGRSTIALSLGASQSAHDDRKVYSVDPHSSHVGVYGGKFGPADREAYYRNMLASGFTHRAALVNFTSSQAALAWQEPIGLLYIDGDHRYEAVRADINAWSAFLVAGGVVVFDDASDRKGGPHRVVEDLTASGGFQSLRTVGAMHALKKL